MAARKAAAEFSIRPPALSCSPRWAIGRTNTDRLSPPVPRPARRRTVADDRCTIIALQFPIPTAWPQTSTNVGPQSAGDWPSIAVLQGEGLRSALVWAKKGKHGPPL